MAKPKRKLAIEIMEAIPEAFTFPLCVQCARPMEVNTPERWVNERGNYEGAWWNNTDFYCPNCHSFQNVGDAEKHRYIKPVATTLETGKSIITRITTPDNVFPPTESA